MSIWKSFCRQVESKPVRRHFVRVTKTMLVDIGGGKWSRKHGKRIPRSYLSKCITDDDLDRIETTVSRVYVGMSIHGIPVYVSGTAGHFADAGKCRLVLHWRVGDLRISTVGQYMRCDELTTIGSGRWSETMVFRVDDPAAPHDLAEGVVVGEVATVYTDVPFTAPAEALHHAVAGEIAKLVAAGTGDDDESIAAACEAALAQVEATLPSTPVPDFVAWRRMREV